MPIAYPKQLFRSLCDHPIQSAQLRITCIRIISWKVRKYSMISGRRCGSASSSSRSGRSKRIQFNIYILFRGWFNSSSARHRLDMMHVSFAYNEWIFIYFHKTDGTTTRGGAIFHLFTKILEAIVWSSSITVVVKEWSQWFDHWIESRALLASMHNR